MPTSRRASPPVGAFAAPSTLTRAGALRWPPAFLPPAFLSAASRSQVGRMAGRGRVTALARSAMRWATERARRRCAFESTQQAARKNVSGTTIRVTTNPAATVVKAEPVVCTKVLSVCFIVASSHDARPSMRPETADPVCLFLSPQEKEPRAARGGPVAWRKMFRGAGLDAPGPRLFRPGSMFLRVTGNCLKLSENPGWRAPERGCPYTGRRAGPRPDASRPPAIGSARRRRGGSRYVR